MPYSGANDSKLPANVKKLPIGKRRRWVAIWNSTFRQCRSQSQGKGSVKRCETRAFRTANGTVKELTMDLDYRDVLAKMRGIAKEEGLDVLAIGDQDALLARAIKELSAPSEAPEESECACEVKEGEKCPHDLISLMPKPFGGATSFVDYDEYEDAIDTEMHVKELGSIFRFLVNNIFEDEEMSLPQKADAVVAAATELSTRVKAPPPQAGVRGIIDKMKDAVKNHFTGKVGVSTHNPAHIVEGAWDGAKARMELRRWASSDGSGDPDKINWNKFRRGFAAVDSPSDKLGSFWGPHHRIHNGTLMTQRSGVIAAFGAAKGARAGAGRPDALAHLNAHRRQFGIGQAELEEILGVSFKELGLPDDIPSGSFASYKDADGQWRWMIINTNKFEDREGEIFSVKSHKEYIAYVEKSGDWPELWLWHTPGTRLGVASLVDYVDGFVVHSGTYDEGMEDVAENLSKMQHKCGVSHGYEYLLGDEEDKVYEHYRTFELTICPAARAANIWGTEFATFLKEVTMGFSKDKREFFVEALGEERVAALETRLPALEKELEGEDVNFKEMIDDLLKPVEAKAEGEEEGGEAGEEKPTGTEKPTGDEKPAGKGEEAGEETPAGDKRLEKIEADVTTIGQSVAALVTSNKELVEGIGDRIAQGLSDALTGRRQAPKTKENGGGQRPSEDPENVQDKGAISEAFKIGGDAPGREENPASKYVDDLANAGTTQG